MDQILQLEKEFNDDVLVVNSIADIEGLRVKFLGKSGLIAKLMQNLANLDLNEKKNFGIKVNTLKNHVLNEISAKQENLLLLEQQQKISNEYIDITLPGRESCVGVKHPISFVMEELRYTLKKMDFNEVHGPEIENDWYNFTALNILENHPARQMHDTFYIDDNILLRTQTSNVQIHQMQEHQPPFSFYTMGKTYRSDSDATHSPMFHQIEIVHVQKSVSIANLKYFLESFLREFFEVSDLPIRLRSSYFPFTEPSIEVDVLCDRSSKDKVVIGTGSDWIEILGCGIIHQKVLSNCNVDSAIWQGFAVGAGIERLAMLKYGIPDLRKFYESDMRWLKNIGANILKKTLF